MEEIILVKSEIILPKPKNNESEKILDYDIDNEYSEFYKTNSNPKFKDEDQSNKRQEAKVKREPKVKATGRKSTNGETYEGNTKKTDSIALNSKIDAKNILLEKRSAPSGSYSNNGVNMMVERVSRGERVKKKRFLWLKSFISIIICITTVIATTLSYQYIGNPIDILGAAAVAFSFPVESFSKVSSYIMVNDDKTNLNSTDGNNKNQNNTNSSDINQNNSNSDSTQNYYGYNVVDNLTGSGYNSSNSSNSSVVNEKDTEDKNIDTSGDEEEKSAKNSKDDGVVSVINYKSYKNDNTVSLGSGYIKNLSSLSNSEVLKIAGQKPKFTVGKSDNPQVLIMHTHATESFLEDGATTFDSKRSFRTTDNELNMVSVGSQIAKELNAAGIKTIQDDTKHDYPSYTGSYERSAVTVKKYLKKYPSIKVVLDVHRDAIARSNKEIVSAVADINGKAAAQVMIISGCDNGTMNMPKYKENLKFAALLQRTMEESYPGLTRPVLFDYRKYNQDLTTGSILIEVGSHGNTHEQVMYSGELIGKSLVKALTLK